VPSDGRRKAPVNPGRTKASAGPPTVRTRSHWSRPSQTLPLQLPPWLPPQLPPELPPQFPRSTAVRRASTRRVFERLRLPVSARGSRPVLRRLRFHVKRAPCPILVTVLMTALMSSTPSPRRLWMTTPARHPRRREFVHRRLWMNLGADSLQLSLDPSVPPLLQLLHRPRPTSSSGQVPHLLEWAP